MFPQASLGRRLAAGTLLIWQLALALGLWLPLPGGTKNARERFPCETCGCGCLTADQCWRDCCCFTNEQRLEWARRNGVRPPEFVVAAAAAEAIAQAPPKCPHCCQHKSKLSTRPAEVALGSGVPRDARASRGISALSALRCQGLLEYWQVLATAWPGLTPGVPEVETGPPGWLRAPPSQRHALLPPALPTPPPRFS